MLAVSTTQFESNGIVIWIFLKHQADTSYIIYHLFLYLISFIFLSLFIFVIWNKVMFLNVGYISSTYFFPSTKYQLFSCLHLWTVPHAAMLLCFWIWNNCQGARDKIAHTVTTLLDWQKLNSMLSSKMFGWQLHNCDTNVIEISKTCETSHLVENLN